MDNQTIISRSHEGRLLACTVRIIEPLVFCRLLTSNVASRLWTLDLGRPKLLKPQTAPGGRCSDYLKLPAELARQRLDELQP
jgi:hypothetical protein